SPSIWDARTGELIARCRDSARVNQWAGDFGPDGTWFATFGRDGSVSIWHTRSGELRRGPMTNPPSVLSLIVSPDGRRLLVCGRNWWRLWNAATGEAVTDVRTNPPSQTPGAFSPDGKKFCVPATD